MKINLNLTGLAVTLALLIGTTNASFADGNAFTPLNFDDTNQAITTKTAPKTNPISKIMPKTSTAPIGAATGEIPVGNDNIQNAILELDNAQVGIRNDLLDYKAKYADIDAQYKLIKNERSMLYKQVRSIEKRIKNIDKAKDKIRKNML